MYKRFNILYILAFIIMIMNGSVYARTNIREFTTPAGIRVWFIPEPQLPIVSITFSFRGGSAYEKPERQGLAQLLSMMLLAGTQHQTRIQLQETLLEKAIDISFTTSQDRFVGSLRTSTQTLDEAVQILKEILYFPRFEQFDLNRLKLQQISVLKNQIKKPEMQASLDHRRMIMGNHPYVRNEDGNTKTLPGITVKDLKLFLKTHFNRHSLIIGACGHISEDKLGKIVDKLFAELPEQTTVTPLVLPQANYTAQTKIVTSTAPQATVLFSHPGLSHQHPDFIKLNILNYILGDGLTSRLGHEIREKRGLAYVISTQLHNLEKIQMISGYFGSDNARTPEAITTVQQIWKNIQQHGITQNELDHAKTYLIGAFPLIFNSTKQTANALHMFQVYGLTPDYFVNRTSILKSITLDEMNFFIKNFMNPQQLVFTVSGDSKFFEQKP